MSKYYLMSQLPSLDQISDGVPLPITEERFDALCTQFLGKGVLKALNKLTLHPARTGESAKHSFVDAWNQAERQLRLALGTVRAKKWNKQFDAGNERISAELTQTAQEVIELDDPLEAEKFLNRHRLAFLESIRPMDPFSDDAVLYYGLKLKLITRIRQFDEEKGRNVYEQMYSSIVRGDEQEVEQ